MRLSRLAWRVAPQAGNVASNAVIFVPSAEMVKVTVPPPSTVPVYVVGTASGVAAGDATGPSDAVAAAVVAAEGEPEAGNGVDVGAAAVGVATEPPPHAASHRTAAPSRTVVRRIRIIPAPPCRAVV
jgi:hypothetical protein